MRANSLALRLFLWATGWTVVILIITGIALSLYRDAVERAFDRRLDVYLRTLVADVASPEEGPTKFPSRSASRCSNCRCRAGTGRSRGPIPKSPRCARRARCGTRSCREARAERAATAGRHPLGYARGRKTRTCGWSSATVDLGADGRYLIAVAGDASEIDDETRSFDYYHRRHLPRAHGRAAVDHGVAGALRPGAAQAHFGESRRHPLRPRRAA
jgi:hypothetical protein